MGFGFSRIMGKKIIRGIILALLFVSAFIMIFGLSFRLAAFDEGFYKKEFAKYGVYENLQGHDVKSINKGVLDYLLKEDGNIIAGSFFNEREKGHLLDVRIIIRKFLFIYHASIFFFFEIGSHKCEKRKIPLMYIERISIDPPTENGLISPIPEAK